MAYENSPSETRRRTFHATDVVTVCDVNARGARRGVVEVEPHPFDRLVLPLRGVFTRHESATRERVATPNHALLVASNEPFLISYAPNAYDHCLVLCWSAAARDDAIGGAIRRGAVASDALLSPALMLARSLLWRRLVAGDADPLEIEERSTGLIDGVLTASCGAPRDAVAGAARRRLRRQLERVKEAVTLEPERRWTLRELASLAGASPYHLAHVFRAEIGTSVYDYVLRTRLAHALERVLDDEVDLTTVALDTGFSSHSHFTNRIRTTFGIAPSVLRERAASRWGAVGEPVAARA
jgi:AraC-like DNA-binding protein